MQRLSAKRVLFHFAETLCVSIDPCMYKKNMPVYFIWSSVSVADKWTQALSRLRDERPPPPDPSARSPLGRGALLVQLGLLKLGFFQFRVFWSMQRGRTHFYCNVASFQTVTCVTFLRSMKNCVVVNGTGLVLGSSNWKDLLLCIQKQTTLFTLALNSIENPVSLLLLLNMEKCLVYTH